MGRKRTSTPKTTKQESALSDVLVSTEPQAFLNFNEFDFPNWGKFVPFVVDYGRAYTDADRRFSEYDRRNQVILSRHYVENLPEVSAGMSRLADFTVGTALIPQFNGKNQEWANTFKKNYLNRISNRLTNLGIAADWQTLWRTVLKLVLTDGDLLMIPYTDRYGLPNLDFVEGHAIRSRDVQNVIKGGRFDGYECEDGVIYDGARNVVGYQILGKTPEEDYTISVANCFLIYSPFSFSKGRGKPLLAASARHARNMLDYQHYIPQLVKVETGVQLVETNAEGRAPVGRTAYNSAANSVAPLIAPNPSGNIVPAITEYTQAGIRYVKSATGKLEPFKGSRPSNEVQSYVTATQKEMLCPLFPHELLLSPEKIGGPGARGVKEMLVASINTHRAMIEKYALVALQYVMAVGLSNPNTKSAFNVPTNFEEDWTDWSFSRAPEPSFDPGYERAADIADLKAGVTSKPRVLARDGLEEDPVNKEIDSSARKTATLITNFIKDFPALAQYAPQLYGITPHSNTTDEALQIYEQQLQKEQPQKGNP